MECPIHFPICAFFMHANVYIRVRHRPVMTYTITSYRKGFSDAQERVGTTVTKDWTFFAQTPADQLEQAYSQPDFDPETRHYCFKDDELVGFLTSSVEEGGKASLEFPLVLPSHKEAESLLFEKAVDVLRQKGVKTVRTRVSEGWGNTVDMATKWGYTFAEELAVVYRITVDTITIKEVPGLEKITDYEHEKDFEQMVDIFVTTYNMTPEHARTNFEMIENAGDKVVAHLVMRKEGKIIGRALVLRHNDPLQAYTGTIYVTEENQRALLLTKILQICKEKKIKTLDAPIAGELLPQKDEYIALYESFGFTRSGILSYYEKEI